MTFNLLYLMTNGVSNGIVFEYGNNKSLLLNTPPFNGVPLTHIDLTTIMKNAVNNLPYRDTIDDRIINDVNHLSGNIIFSQDDVGGYI